MPIDELLELFKEKVLNEIEKFYTRPLQVQNEELITIDDACKFLKVSKVTIHKWKKIKLICSYRIGRRVYFKKTELLNSLRKG